MQEENIKYTVQPRLRHIMQSLCWGKSVARSFFNASMRHVVIRGKVVDVGSGPRAYYHDFFVREGEVDMVSMDQKIGDQVNFECDRLPWASGEFDTVVCMNVLEHIYNHQHLMNELARIVKQDGQAVLFVPFFVIYHPEPGFSLDCFRYTKDALSRIAADAGFQTVKIEEVGLAMFTVSANLILQSLPRFLRPILFLPAYGLDKLLVRIKPKYRSQFPLGYMVYAAK